MNRIFFRFSPLLLFVLLGACSTSFNAHQNISELSNNNLEVSQRIYRHQSDSSLLIFKIDAKHLLYTRQSSSSNFTANLNIHLELYDFERKNLLFKDSLLFHDEQNFSSKGQLVGQIAFPFNRDGKFLLEVNYHDENRNNEAFYRLNLFKNGEYSNHDIILTKPNGLPLISFINTDTGTFKMASRRANNTYKVSYVKASDKLPKPPYVEDPGLQKERVTYTGQKQVKLQLNNPGFYQVESLDNLGQAFSFFHQPAGFPKTSDYNTLIKALGYILSTKELDAIAKKKDKRSAFEQFWLDVCGNKEKAKRCISEYYWRMEQCNRFFTKEIEGWQSERGMIFMLMGVPTRRYQQGNEEYWVYGRDNNINNLTFNFYYDDDSKDVRLERSPSYRQIWRLAVNTWRSGKVFKY